MKKILLEIAGLINSQTQSGAYTLILGDEQNGRRLPVLIGYSEAQSIAMVLDGIEPPRPLTHDLFKNFSETFGITISEVIIYSLKEGIFYAKLICSNGDDSFEIDARTSDAVALSIRFGCPIFTFENILEKAGISIEQGKDKTKEKLAGLTQIANRKKATPTGDFNTNSIEELNELLGKAIEDEAYERASKIRDEIKRRGGAS